MNIYKHEKGVHAFNNSALFSSRFLFPHTAPMWVLIPSVQCIVSEPRLSV